MDIQIIHIVLGKANPNKMNGVNKVVNELATAQINLGFKVAIWGITKSLQHNYPNRNYDTVLFKDKGRFLIDKTIGVKLQSVPKNTIFHFHGGFIPQFYFIAKLLVKMQFEFVYTPHGAYNALALKRSKIKKKFFLKTFDKFLVKNAKNVHFIGQSEVDNGLTLFGNMSHVLIPNGQTLKSQKLHNNSHSGKRVPVFGFMGRLDIHTKGLDLLLKGFRDFIVNEGGEGVLQVIGDGKALRDLKGLAQKLGISDRVDFKGGLFGKRKEMALNEIDVFCLTSRNEGLPGVVLEAASYGVPSIVSEATNMKSYINAHQSGWVLPENTVSNIASTLKAVQLIFQAGKLMPYQKNALAMLQVEFNWIHIAKAHINNYEK